MSATDLKYPMELSWPLQTSQGYVEISPLTVQIAIDVHERDHHPISRHSVECDLKETKLILMPCTYFSYSMSASTRKYFCLHLKRLRMLQNLIQKHLSLSKLL